MTRITRDFEAISWELGQLISKSPPYALSTPQLGTPTLHDFVKGLILSTHVAEAIQEHIPNGYRADWGQVIGEDGNILSRECDVVVYKGKPYKPIENRSMRFVLVKRKRARVVIQVRSSIQSVTKDDAEYCKQLKGFVPRVWFLAECCWANSENRAKTLKRQLKQIGYEHFFYLMRKNIKGEVIEIGDESFYQFIKLVERIK